MTPVPNKESQVGSVQPSTFFRHLQIKTFLHAVIWNDFVSPPNTIKKSCQPTLTFSVIWAIAPLLLLSLVTRNFVLEQSDWKVCWNHRRNKRIFSKNSSKITKINISWREVKMLMRVQRVLKLRSFYRLSSATIYSLNSTGSFGPTSWISLFKKNLLSWSSYKNVLKIFIILEKVLFVRLVSRITTCEGIRFLFSSRRWLSRRWTTPKKHFQKRELSAIVLWRQQSQTLWVRDFCGVEFLSSKQFYVVYNNVN